jgi:hypothetical protein
MVADGHFDDEALQSAGRTLVTTGVMSAVPPLDTWVDKQFVPVQAGG